LKLNFKNCLMTSSNNRKLHLGGQYLLLLLLLAFYFALASFSLQLGLHCML
jgi:hypothetical protein